MRGVESEGRMQTSYIGIDPGKKGAVVVLGSDGSFFEKVGMQSPHGICACLGEHSAKRNCHVLLERVHAMPGQGVVSMFTFGQYYGIWWALKAFQIPYETITPQAWMKVLGIPKKDKRETKPEFKRRLATNAQNRFPNEKITLQYADAFLIAEACRRIVKK